MGPPACTPCAQAVAMVSDANLIAHPLRARPARARPPTIGRAQCHERLAADTPRCLRCGSQITSMARPIVVVDIRL